jgi:putative Mg2+ transporter-C (MgtC) family protein
MDLLTIGRGELIGRLALAVVLGSLIGLERERGERAAGMRTHALVCLGSSVFMLVSAYGLAAVASGAPPATQTALRSIDPFRVAAQVVSGIGFIGAGAIFFRREIVRGLTTAAGLWVVAGIGLAVGAGMYLVSIGGAIASLIVLAGFRPLEDRLFKRPERLIINVQPREGQLPAIREAFAASHFQLYSLTLLAGEKAKQEMIRAEYGLTPGADIEQLVDGLRRVPGCLSIDQVTLHLEGGLGSNGYRTEIDADDVATDGGGHQPFNFIDRLRSR